VICVVNAEVGKAPHLKFKLDALLMSSKADNL
jgi:hypothetical protein